MPFEERCEIIQGFTGVAETSAVDDNDGTVCEALRRLKPTYFANGGDRKTDNTPEMDVCEEENISLLWNMGGGKIQSSSTLVKDSGMVSDGEIETDPDLIPTRVEVVSSTDVPKNSKY